MDVAVFEKAAELAPTLTPFELPAEAAALDEDERRAVLNLVKVMVRNKQTPAPFPAADFHPEQAGYDLAAHHWARVAPASRVWSCAITGGLWARLWLSLRV